jgi:hypothetical protein
MGAAEEELCLIESLALLHSRDDTCNRPAGSPRPALGCLPFLPVQPLAAPLSGLLFLGSLVFDHLPMPPHCA